MAGQSKQAVELHQMGVVALQRGQVDAALELIRRAIAINADYAEAWGNLGNVLTVRGEVDEAIAAYRRAIELNSDLAEAHSNLGNALRESGRVDEAVAACRRAIAISPGFAKAWGNLGNGLKEQGKFDEAMEAYRRAIALDPKSPETHYNFSFALLATGEFQRGWEEYEWRWKCAGFPSARRHFSQPVWNGEALGGRRILIHAEQGFGDAIQFVRYVPMVVERGGRVIVQCPGELVRLFRMSLRGCEIVGAGEALAGFDFHCPLLSLPRIFGTTLETIPRVEPYLRADDGNVERWRDRMAGCSAELKVGLAWAGSAVHKNDRNRSMKLEMFGPLGRMAGVRFFSLQKGKAAAEIQNSPAGMEIVDWTEELKDFGDTAGLIANLDLVIAVDTAAAHLAGAMGKPVWTMLAFVPDWRWLLGRVDTPWYPTMRLWRQSLAGDWDGVIARVGDALSVWVGNRG
jgi:TPR repeat/Glycosyltransferase family 9 (heptosyltransferase)/Tetratricopeptide repeat